MLKKPYLFACTLAVVVAAISTVTVHSQSPASETLLRAPEAAKVLPPSVFFRGQSASIQGRNSAGIKYPDGMFVLTTLVDNSGYSTSIQQKYQAYLITEVPIEINGKDLVPGAYGTGFVQGHFTVMDVGDHDLLSVDSTRDTKLGRPTPLQILAGETPGHYRLYQGRDYVVISRK